MAKIMKTIAVISITSTVVTWLVYNRTSLGFSLTLAISFGTIAYHFTMRLLVGVIFNSTMNNKADLSKKWYQVREFELKLYKKLKVQRWKKFLPTYDTNSFDRQNHTWNEIAQTMCQAELVHEVIFVLSFVPISFGVWFGDYPVFIITSILAGSFDLIFVIAQRYNRQKVMKILQKENN